MTIVRFLKQNAGFILVTVLLLACVAVWAAVYAEHSSGVLTLAVLNIGQGDALFIESPTGIQVVVDGGPDSSILRELPKVMPSFDRSIDAVIETHPDADHIGGFVDVLQRYKVGAFIKPGILKNTATNRALEREVAVQKLPTYIARRGMTLDLGGGAYLHILYPDHDVSRLNENRANEGAVVAHLIYGETFALLTADVPGAVEKRLLALDGAGLQSGILKVGHHGSRTSTDAAFLSAVMPATAVISVGARNTYGHPTKEVLQRLSGRNINILRTDENGTVICRSNGAVFSCSGER